jgi:hypothetical protein
MKRKIVKAAMPSHKARAALNLNPVSLTLCTEVLPADIGIHFTMCAYHLKNAAHLQCELMGQNRDVLPASLVEGYILMHVIAREIAPPKLLSVPGEVVLKEPSPCL